MYEKSSAFKLAVSLRTQNGMDLDELIDWMVENGVRHTGMCEMMYWMKDYGVVQQRRDGKLSLIGASFSVDDLGRVVKAMNGFFIKRSELPFVKKFSGTSARPVCLDMMPSIDSLSLIRSRLR